VKPEPRFRAVEVRREVVVLPTYEPHRPDRNPMFLEKRVYQGSSGRVYPLPFTDRIAERPRPRSWEAVFIENEYLRVMILPALGGRIHRIQDKTNGYDLIYHQPVIKPALVGLAGPWASGGIEFNWPQHHRPSTFMPADVALEEHADGAATVWLSEHDPMARMKGMHGVRLHPGRSCLELVARAYNRTPDVQTFLWWANVATRVHELYQSFFPPDVTFVADHARRAISAFPLCQGRYYGVDYGARPSRGVPPDERPAAYPTRNAGFAPSAKGGQGPEYPPNDLSWYANIPVPTSYMALGSTGDFVGGYDHRAQAGIVHVAPHAISPGKKQWTWGNSAFGYAWDRNLTDADAHGEHPPYIELMAGAYTDNQPDFSFLQPGETKTWSQFWYPIRKIGPPRKATLEAALSFRVDRGIAHVGVCVTRRQPAVTIQLRRGSRRVAEWVQALAPDHPLVFESAVDPSDRAEDFALRVLGRDGGLLLALDPSSRTRPTAAPPPATEPPPPGKVASNDELFVIGLHLEQYRHATRMPEPYWREGLRRDPGDSRCHLALGRWHLRRGEFEEAERHLRASIDRLVSRNPNPYDGEAHYQLGLCLRHRAWANDLDRTRLDEACAALAKAAWNQAWQPAAHHALAEIDALLGRWPDALENVERALRAAPDNLRARNLKAIALRALGDGGGADARLKETLGLDPLDWWARHLAGETLACDGQVRLDLALDYAHAGRFADALDVLAAEGSERRALPSPRGVPKPDLPDGSLGTGPMLAYTRAWMAHRLGDARAVRRHLARAARQPTDYCFPARLEEIAILRLAIAKNPRDGRARYYLGNLLYDRRRHSEAIELWEESAALEPDHAVVWRNLGIGYFNIEGRPEAARRAYDRARAAAPADGRLVFERDQLWKRLGIPVRTRLNVLRRRAGRPPGRDDLAVELCALHNQVGAPRRALRLLRSRRFQPWEGGEGLALRQHVRAHLALGRADLARKRPASAVRHFRAALEAPENLGEAHHPLANQSDALYGLGLALRGAGDPEGARDCWTRAAGFGGDFQNMKVRAVSEMTYYSALALRALGREAEAARLLREVRRFAKSLARAPATLDYFATSLPTMLLFEDDLKERQMTTALFLEAQAELGLGRKARGAALLSRVLSRDPSHPHAADLAAEAALHIG
jgi:tetratricopeptide (TPR) repeat protein